jgi:L-lactate dehydrogenase (cytochrome)
MTALDTCADIADLRALAKKRLPRVLFDYIDGGSYGEVTLARNRAALDAMPIEQRVMRDMSAIDMSVTLFGEHMAMPVILGPVGFAGMYARRGEAQAAVAARSAGLPFCLSTVGICTVAEVAQASGTPPWFQLYMVKDRAVVAALLSRAWDAGARVLILTVDLPTPGARYRDLRSGMMRSLGVAGALRQAGEGIRHPGWLADVWMGGRPHSFGMLADAAPSGSSFAEAWSWIAANFDPSVTWADLAWVKSRWPGHVVVKGIMHEDDAEAAIASGADAIVVSNHGGRQLDGVAATADVLPAISNRVGGRVPVLVDGGIRSGLDILKLLNHGADACLLGRAWAFGLAAGGTRGVAKALTMIKAELTAGMILSGRARI